MSGITQSSLLEMFVFETTHLLEQLEQITMNSEKNNVYSSEDINEIFRIMHTIKGSAAMMSYNNLLDLAHAMEDLFQYIREKKPVLSFTGLTDLVLNASDFIQKELGEIEKSGSTITDPQKLIAQIKGYLENLKQGTVPQATGGQKCYKAVMYFEDNCLMEDVRAFAVIHNIKGLVSDLSYHPSHLEEGSEVKETIRKDGFTIFFRTDQSLEKLRVLITESALLKSLSFEEIDQGEVNPETLEDMSMEPGEAGALPLKDEETNISLAAKSPAQNMITVSVAKLDKLMDLMGEMVIAESMVIHNPDLKGLELDNFYKSARQLNKITSEMQDIVMAIRMVPLSHTFNKMRRIVRDMCRTLGKEVELVIRGEETEVDKNVIEHITDPLIHLVRNAIDHGIELPAERTAKGKPRSGRIMLEAKNAGSDVLIVVKDDGQGLKSSKILEKAESNGLLHRAASEMTPQEIYNLILLPGFSTNETVSEYSGRGVGMDVVMSNIELIGGSVMIDSTEGQGTTITLKIPLTLAIIDGINIKVGKVCFTIPTTSIRSFFTPNMSDITTDPNGNEMLIVRGNCYPILRLHEFYKIKFSKTNFVDGIFILIELDGKTVCLFADELLGKQQVVIKSLPNYVRHVKRIRGLAGCTLLGDGRISLVLDLAGLVSA